MYWEKPKWPSMLAKRFALLKIEKDVSGFSRSEKIRMNPKKLKGSPLLLQAKKQFLHSET